MAVKEIRPAKSKLTDKQKKLYSGIFIIFVIFTVFCFGFKIKNDYAIAVYEQQIAEVQQKVDALNKENDENFEVINSTDRSEYYGKVAREVYGYGKPGEFIFYKAES